MATGFMGSLVCTSFPHKPHQTDKVLFLTQVVWSILKTTLLPVLSTSCINTQETTSLAAGQRTRPFDEDY